MKNIFIAYVSALITATLFAGVFIPGAAVKLAVIESMDGLAFTVGGLVIAAVAIFTQINLRDQINRTLDERLDTFKENMEKNMEKVVESYFVFTEAVRNIGSNWEDAESLARNALQIYPNLKKTAAPVMGVRYAEYLSRMYLAKHRGVYPPLNEIRGQVEIPPEASLPIREAIIWLEDAKSANQQTGSNARVRLALAIMYALADRFGNMCNELQEIFNQQDETTKELAIDCFCLMLYTFSCRYHTKDKLEVLSKILRTIMPVSQSDVCKRTLGQLRLVASAYDAEQRAPVGRSGTNIIASYWCVMPRKMGGAYTGVNLFPTILHMMRVTSNNGEYVVNAELERGASLLGKPVSVQQAVSELYEKYYFVSQIPHPIEATRDTRLWLLRNNSITLNAGNW